MIGSVIAGLVGQGGANSAAGAVGGATQQAINFAQNQANVNRSDASPWVSSGRSALSEIGKILGWGDLANPGTEGSTWEFTGDPDGSKRTAALNAFQVSPGYQFRKTEGINALDRSAAARGSLRSGAQMKAVQGFGDNLASAEYGDQFGRYLTLAGMGGQQQANVANLNSSLTSNMGSWGIDGAKARGSSYIQGANAFASGIGSGINNALFLGGYGLNKGWFDSSGPHSLGGTIAVAGS